MNAISVEVVAAKEKVVLRAMVWPGDLLMLTVALRDLHLACPGRFITDTETTCRELWRNNPHVTPVNRIETHRFVNVGYPSYGKGDAAPPHIASSYHKKLSDELGVDVPVTKLVPEVFLDEQERDDGFIRELGLRRPYWVIIAGGKYDTTTKWWNPANYQAVVDMLAGRVRFVQCGKSTDWHPPLNNVTNYVGRGNIRELIRLIYHADGVLCPVTFAMHLSAAVPTPSGRPRPCVVLVGGREPPSLVQYPNHTLLHTIGQLPCCEKRGCWRYVCQETHVPQHLKSRCEYPVHVARDLKIPRCMEMISPGAVVEAILAYRRKIYSRPGPPSIIYPPAPSQKPRRFAYTHPRHLQELYEYAGGNNVYGRAVRDEADLRRLIKSKGPVDLLILGNLQRDTAALIRLCNEHNIDRCFGEFGWFPHYQTVHADPGGYAWESSLCRQRFTGITPQQREVAEDFRKQHLAYDSPPLPEQVRPPFVFWPLQLIDDRVNRFDLNVTSWYELLLWARQIIPVQYQLVIKHHPVSSNQPRLECVRWLPKTVVLDKGAPIRPLLEQANGVIGCNSTVLLESRLLYRRATWAFGRSWYTGHPELVTPICPGEPLPGSHALTSGIEDPWLLDYGDWFLWELLWRQHSRDAARRDPKRFLEWIHRRTFAASQKQTTATA